ncbi:hypothetical protein STCU_11856 [Strigomonas culicis]|uniref:Uncharacterized protein n=1 Tax=Strigomonas culicis TaxID=28005 RepID=S9TFG3_9TRYP|nr:hypothetical protein STCU_11856 [Strigomonas culicis]|eukprot:EPY15659.1 hypothetical protein STCU_11856 [Strigomonas culicis]
MTQHTLLPTLLQAVCSMSTVSNRTKNKSTSPTGPKSFQLEFVQTSRLQCVRGIVPPTVEETHDLQLLYLYYAKHRAALSRLERQEANHDHVLPSEGIVATACCTDATDLEFYTDYIVLKDDFLSPLLEKHRGTVAPTNAKGGGGRSAWYAPWSSALRFEYRHLYGLQRRLQQKEAYKKDFISIVQELIKSNCLRHLLILNPVT